MLINFSAAERDMNIKWIYKGVAQKRGALHLEGIQLLEWNSLWEETVSDFRRRPDVHSLWPVWVESVMSLPDLIGYRSRRLHNYHSIIICKKQTT